MNIKPQINATFICGRSLHNTNKQEGAVCFHFCVCVCERERGGGGDEKTCTKLPREVLTCLYVGYVAVPLSPSVDLLIRS